MYTIIYNVYDIQSGNRVLVSSRQNTVSSAKRVRELLSGFSASFEGLQKSAFSLRKMNFGKANVGKKQEAFHMVLGKRETFISVTRNW